MIDNPRLYALPKKNSEALYNCMLEICSTINDRPGMAVLDNW